MLRRFLARSRRLREWIGGLWAELDDGWTLILHQDQLPERYPAPVVVVLRRRWARTTPYVGLRAHGISQSPVETLRTESGAAARDLVGDVLAGRMLFEAVADLRRPRDLWPIDLLEDVEAAEDRLLFFAAPEPFASDRNGQGHRTRSAEDELDREGN